MNTRLVIVKTILWGLVGVLAVVTLARFWGGLGSATSLSDATPWGLWIAFDVMSGVALAAGGFVLAGTVYIFGLERYRPFVRPAILTALLGYIAVAVGLLYDLGLPWHIWHPIIYPQHHSVLFEVAMCVMLYLTVLSLEFAPAVLEHRWLDRPLFHTVHRLVHGAVIPLVVAGIVLSTLHQSSLGSLFLIAPYRLHPLWYSPIIWILFFVSAIGLGLMTVTAESYFSAWLFGHKLKMNRLAGLGRAASFVLFIYAGLRLGDLAVRGRLGLVFDGSWQASVFVAELFFSAILPATLLLFRPIRTSKVGLGTCAAMTILGIIAYRFDVCIIAFSRPEAMPYFPSWMEIAVSLGIVAGATLVFIFFVENLKVYSDDHASTSAETVFGRRGAEFSPVTMQNLLPDSLGAARRYSFAAIIAAALTVAILPSGLWSETQVRATPVSASRTLVSSFQEPGSGVVRSIGLTESATTAASEGVRQTVFLSIDGNRNGQPVLFPHDQHVAALGEQHSCGTCHHQNMPLDTNTSCFECHRDMYLETDIFDHYFHVMKLDGSNGCSECHQDRSEVKNRRTATACVECHEDMLVSDSAILPPKDGIRGFAVGYMDAMHGLCIGCHEQRTAENTQSDGPDCAQCANCHRDGNALPAGKTRSYVASRTER